MICSLFCKTFLFAANKDIKTKSKYIVAVVWVYSLSIYFRSYQVQSVILISNTTLLEADYQYLRRYAANNWQISTSCLYIVE